MSGGTLYDHDFVAWIDQQVALIREGRPDKLDLVNLAEELEDMGKSRRQELRSRLEVLLAHLLKYEFQPEARSKSWLASIAEQRNRIADVIDENPSLHPYLLALHDDERTYPRAVKIARIETGLPKDRFPAINPYGDRALNDGFWPGPGPHPEP